MIACGVLALLASDGVDITVVAIFAVVLAGAWKLEAIQWQLSEHTGLLLVLVALPLSYVDWRYQLSSVAADGERIGLSSLTHLVLFISCIKLLQVKTNRDWLFLYLISFFEVLLAAGSSISLWFLVVLSFYMFSAVSTIVCFEIRKAKRSVKKVETQYLNASNPTLWKRLAKLSALQEQGKVWRLPLVAFCLLVLIFALALPLFFVMPRFGKSALARTNGGSTGLVGFSDSVTLGDIGRLQQNDRIVMRVKVEHPQAARHQKLRWRGVALDSFDGRRWKRSTQIGSPKSRSEQGLFQLGTTESLDRLTTQTFFVEPLDTPVLFAAPRVIALHSTLPYIRQDKEDGLSTRQHSAERIMYRAYSDTLEPEPSVLRTEPLNYTWKEEKRVDPERYLQSSENLDPRIEEHARGIVEQAQARNHYDAARAIEAYLSSSGAYSYTLEMLSGNGDPLADFLFRVRKGHCEYFSTAMAVMLRTLGIKARIVNGFQMGEYNQTADAYTVRQRDAHSWVEVYFPSSDSWVSFDPTPAAGRPGSSGETDGGLRAQLSQYAEALELLWIQYVVAYDKHEQRSLANSLRAQLSLYNRALINRTNTLRDNLRQQWQQQQMLMSKMNWSSSYLAYAGVLILLGSSVTITAFFIRRVQRYGFTRDILRWHAAETKNSVVAFYNRMITTLEKRGLQRTPDQTPLEFAVAVEMPEALVVTRAYNRVRYGTQNLSATELEQIEKWLKQMEEAGEWPESGR